MILFHKLKIGINKRSLATGRKQNYKDNKKSPKYAADNRFKVLFHHNPLSKKQEFLKDINTLFEVCREKNPPHHNVIKGKESTKNSGKFGRLPRLG